MNGRVSAGCGVLNVTIRCFSLCYFFRESDICKIFVSSPWLCRIITDILLTEPPVPKLWYLTFHVVAFGGISEMFFVCFDNLKYIKPPPAIFQIKLK